METTPASTAKSPEIYSENTVVAETQIFDPHTHAWPHTISNLAPDPRVKFGQLKNGLRYAILPVPDNNKVVSMQMRVAAGFKDEPEGQYGVAHILEHMAFRGARSADDETVAHDLQNVGVSFGLDFNGFTEYDQTHYRINLESPDHSTVYQALENFKNLVTTPNLTAHSLELEKKVVIAELKARETPNAKASYLKSYFKYPDQKRRKAPLGGTEETVNALTLKDVQNFFGSRYIPKNVLVVIAGEIDALKTEKDITSLFGGWKPDPKSSRLSKTHLTETIEIDFETLVSKFPSTSAVKQSDLSTELMAVENKPPTLGNDTFRSRKREHLTKIVNTALYARLKPHIDINTADGDDVKWILFKTLQGELYDTHTVNMGAQGRGYPEAMKLFETERLRSLKFGFTKSEIDAIISSERFKLEDNARLGEKVDAWKESASLRTRFGYGIVYTSRQQDVALFESFVTDLSLEDYNAHMHELWGSFEPRLWMQADYDTERTFEKVKTVLQDLKTADISAPEVTTTAEFEIPDLGAPGKITQRKLTKLHKVNQLTWSNGSQLNYVQDENGTGTAAISIALRGDITAYQDVYMSFAYWASAFSMADIKGLTASDVKTLFASQKADFSVSLAGQNLVLKIQTNNEDLPTALKVATAFIVNYDLQSPDHARNYARHMTHRRHAVKSSPLSAGPQKLTYTWSNKNNAFHTRITGRSDDISIFESHLKTILDDGAIEVGVAGDFDPQTLEQAFATTLGALPQRKRVTPQGDVKITDINMLEPGESTIFHGGSDAQMALFYCWPHSSDNLFGEEAAYDQLMLTIAHQEATKRLRQDLGVTYSPGTYSYTVPEIRGMNPLCLTIQISPDDEGLVRTELETMFNEMGEKPITEDAFNRVKKPILSLLKRYGEMEALHSASLSFAHSNPRDYTYYRNMLSLYSDVNLAKIRDQIQRELSFENMRIIRIQHYESVSDLNKRQLMLRAQDGDAVTQYELGLTFIPAWTDEGRESAELWFGKAANQGHVLANLEMGKLAYKNREYSKAVPYLRLAADEPIAAFLLAEIYFDHPKLFPYVSDEHIMELFHKSAEAGNSDAQRALADRYKDGTMVKQDHVAALKWYFLSTNSYEWVEFNMMMDRYVKGLSEDEINAARTQAREWVKQNEEEE